MGQLLRGLIAGLAVLAALWVLGLASMLGERLGGNADLMVWAALPLVSFAGFLVLHRLSARGAALEAAKQITIDEGKGLGRPHEDAPGRAV